MMAVSNLYTELLFNWGLR